MRTRLDSVRGQVSWLLLCMAVLVGIVTGAGAAGVAYLTSDVQVVVDDLRPEAYSIIELRNDMDTALADVRGWGLSRDPSFLRGYQTAITRARSKARELEALTAGDATLHLAASRQANAVDTWSSVADAWIERHLGRVPTANVIRGDNLFTRFVTLNQELSKEVNGRVEAREDAIRDRGRALIWFVTIVSLAGVALTVVIGRAIVRRVSGPLRDMESGVERLAAGDLTARVSTEGPREIRGVSSALNTLAEENQRAREMEEEVVAQLRRLDRAKDEFVSTVSHELRTPLTSIAGYLELFEDEFGDGLSGQQRGMIGVVRRNVVRLRALIEDLLTLSSVEADAFRTSFGLVDLRHVVSDAARDIAQTAARAEVRIRSSLPERPLLVCGDAGQLSRATLNLLSNAVKFSPPASEVVVGLNDRGEQAVVSVVDHGIGIPAQELPTVGTRFFRASNAVQSEITGTGLGLRIVQTIAHNHGGRLELESELGEGTVARLVVPLAEENEPGNTRPLQDITEG